MWIYASLLIVHVHAANILTGRAITQHPNWYLLDHERCGESTSDRIIGGKSATLGQYPWMVRLGYHIDLPFATLTDVVFKCGGTLINNLYVITAAHCVYAEDDEVVLVRLGELDVRKEIDCEDLLCAPPVQDIRPRRIVFHSRFTPQQMKYDVALIRLARRARLHDFVAPICLPFGKLLQKNLIGLKMEVAGWGVSNMTSLAISPTLLHVGIPVVDNSVCDKTLVNFGKLNKGQLCVGGKEGFDSCSGDSGGPLMFPYVVNGPPKYYLMGIVSYGANKCGGEAPAVYTNVSKYLRWILDGLYP